MFDVLYLVTAAIALVVTVLAVICLARNRPVDWPTFWAAAALEVAVLAVLVSQIVGAASPGVTVSVPTIIGYAIAAVLLTPLAVFWAMVDRTRYGTGAIGVAAVAIMVIMLRLHQVWEVAGA